MVVLGVSEAYTIKTLSWTGEILDGIGGASVVLAQTASGWIVITMERAGPTCARWEIPPR